MAQHDFVPAWLNFSTPQPAKVCVHEQYVCDRVCELIIEKTGELKRQSLSMTVRVTALTPCECVSVHLSV